MSPVSGTSPAPPTGQHQRAMPNALPFNSARPSAGVVRSGTAFGAAQNRTGAAVSRRGPVGRPLGTARGTDAVSAAGLSCGVSRHETANNLHARTSARPRLCYRPHRCSPA